MDIPEPWLCDMQMVSTVREWEGTTVELKWDLAWAQGHISSLKAENIPTYKNNH
jgi:hypothetical protein